MLSFLVACGGDEPIDPTPPTPATPDDPNPPTPEKDTTAPTITVSVGSVNVIASPIVTVSGDELKIGETAVASWKDDKSTTCTVVITFTPTGGTANTINSGDKVSEEGQLQLKVADEAGNSSTGGIALTATAVFGLENLAGLLLQVDQEADLLTGLTIADGLTLQKVEVVQDGARTQVDNPNAYTPEYPGRIDIILTLTRADGSTIEVKGNDLTVKGLDYHPVSLIDIKPVDVFPQIDQIEGGDPNIYSYVEDLRVAEAYVMREMMTEYGVGKYGPEEYQKLLSRIVIGSRSEISDDYQEYPWI